MLLIGRYKGDGKASLKLTGRVNGENKDFAFPMEFAKEDTGHSYLPRLWAMRRIGYLTEVAHANDESKEVVDEIIALSQKYGIISAYTSYLVTDPNERGVRPMPVPMRPMSGVTMSSVNGRISTAVGGRRSAAMSFGSPGASLPPGNMGKSARFDYRPNVFRSESARLPATSLTSFRGRAMVADARGGDVFYGDEGSASDGADMLLDSASSTAHRSSSRSHLNALAGAYTKNAPKEESGQKAVLIAKTLNELKESDAINKQDLMAGEMKTVEDKTFYLVNGFWTESTFKTAAKATKEIKFNSEEYFALMKSVPGITKYLSVGRQVIVEFNGTWYKIIQSGNATG